MKRSCLLVTVLAVTLLAALCADAQVTFPGPELLGRPTDQSVTINVVPNSAIQAYFEYGTQTGGPYPQTFPAAGASGPVSTAANVPLVVKLTGLSPDTQYFYRMIYRKTGTTTWTTRSEYSFHTQRAPGHDFKFTVTSDSHINIVFGNTSLFQQTERNIAADSPDFGLDLGDTFAMDGVTTQTTANSNYLNIRQYFGLAPSVPLFLALGNHEQEEGWHLGDTNGNLATSPPVMSANARNMYYSNPDPLTDSFYSGNTDVSYPAITASSDHTIQDYYAFTWGDALFVVIDPYWYTPVKPYAGNMGGGEPGFPTQAADADRWRWTLGAAQYGWLEQTLAASTAKYKFIFAHQVSGGMDDYGRGGAYAVPYVEWGGYDIDGVTWDFNNQRPFPLPVHQLLVKYNTTVFFHGHDHEFAYEKRDGLVYQLTPMAADATYGYGFADYSESNPYTLRVLPNSGHLRVTVSSTNGVTVDYVRAFLSGQGTNDSVAYSYNIPAPAGPQITATAGSAQSATITNTFGTLLQATVKDANNNPITGVAVTFAAPTSGASGTFAGSGASPATVNTDTNGIATAPAFTANSTAGSYTVTATTAGANTPATFSLTNNPGLPASIVATSGALQSAKINTAFAPMQATVRDAGQNPLSGISVTFAAPTSGASGTFTGSATVMTNASGIATAPVFTANGTPGGYSVTAGTAGVAAPANFNLTNLPGPPSIVATAGNQQSATIQMTFGIALQATVKDANNNPITGVAVTFAAPTSGASGTFPNSAASSATVNTDANGVATAPAFTANNTAGSYTVTATTAGANTAASFSLTNNPGLPASIAATAGASQSATVNAAFGTAMQATVRDAGQNLLSGVSVTFAAPTGGASGTFASSATVMTNASGVATAPAFTANGTSGSYTVTASTAGVATPASFNLTNNAAPSFTTVFINAGGSAYTDSLGQHWAADEDYSGGSDFSVNHAITNTSDPALYETSRSGTSFSYKITAPAGSYSVTLKFAETSFAAKGKRVFDVAINGTQVLTNFDIFASAGAEYKALDKTFKVPSTGTISIQFYTATAGTPMVNAIEVAASQ